MNPPIKHLALILALCVLSLAGTAQAQEETTAAAAKLKEVRARIAALTGRLSTALKERDAAGARLREADLAITAARRRLDALHGAEQATLRRRSELQREAQRVQTALDAERAALASQVRAAYMIGGQERLKMLLSQSDPAAAGRTSVFYGYFAHDRARKIADIDAQVAHVHDLQLQLGQTAARLASVEADTARQVSDLQQARAERASVLKSATRQVTNGGEELARLKREEQAEEALLADLARVMQDFPADAEQPFADLRGKLPWPVAGRVTATYQDPHGLPGMRRNGVLIEAVSGAKVRAPYFGRVLYADWLQGLGLLIIIGHNGNYMTLYGHAEVLYKSVGDWVAPGDTIGALSDAGGAAPQLYFEIREGRFPKDPRTWLKPVP